MLVQLFCWPARRRCSRGSAPSSAPGGASRTEPPLRIAAMPSRCSFASSSTYRKGSPRYRRAFSAYVNSLYIRHTGDARVSSAQPACGRCSRGSAPSSVPEAPRGRSPRYACPLRRQRSVPQRLSMLGWLCGRSAPPSAPGGASRTEPPLRMSAKPLRFSAVEVQRRYRPS